MQASAQPQLAAKSPAPASRRRHLSAQMAPSNPTLARRSRAQALLPFAALLVSLMLPAPALGALSKDDAKPTFRRSLQVYQKHAPAVMDAFKGWKQQHERQYGSGADEAQAIAAFEENLLLVQKWASTKAADVAMGKFADMRWDDFKRTYLSSMTNLTLPSSWMNATEANARQAEQLLQTDARQRRQMLQATPRTKGDSYLSWADKRKYRTPVRDQGKCGACWAFAAIQAIEYAYSIQLDRQGQIPKGYKAAQFSIQQAIDCFTDGQGGCGWGSAAAFYNLLVQRPLVPDSYYPLVANKDATPRSCNMGSVQSAVGANQDIQYSTSSIGYVRLEGVSRDNLKAQLKTSPVVCHFEVDVQFMLYNAKSTPVYKAQTCTGNNLNHALVVVGYDMTTSPPSWIVKNSWGSSWGGLKGYARIAMTDGTGTCGMYKWCFRPDTAFAGGSSVKVADDGQTDGLYDISGSSTPVPSPPPRPPAPPSPDREEEPQSRKLLQ